MNSIVLNLFLRDLEYSISSTELENINLDFMIICKGIFYYDYILLSDNTVWYYNFKSNIGFRCTNELAFKE